MTTHCPAAPNLIATHPALRVAGLPELIHDRLFVRITPILAPPRRDLLGLLLVSRRAGTAEIHMLSVHPPVRNAAGRAATRTDLIERAGRIAEEIAAAQPDGCTRVAVHVDRWARESAAIARRVAAACGAPHLVVAAPEVHTAVPLDGLPLIESELAAAGGQQIATDIAQRIADAFGRGDAGDAWPAEAGQGRADCVRPAPMNGDASPLLFVRIATLHAPRQGAPAGALAIAAARTTAGVSVRCEALVLPPDARTALPPAPATAALLARIAEWCRTTAPATAAFGASAPPAAATLIGLVPSIPAARVDFLLGGIGERLLRALLQGTERPTDARLQRVAERAATEAAQRLNAPVRIAAALSAPIAPSDPPDRTEEATARLRRALEHAREHGGWFGEWLRLAALVDRVAADWSAPLGVADAPAAATHEGLRAARCRAALRAIEDAPTTERLGPQAENLLRDAAEALGADARPETIRALRLSLTVPSYGRRPILAAAFAAQLHAGAAG